MEEEDPATETMAQSDYKSPLSKEGPVLLTSSLVSDTKDDIMMELLQDLKSLLSSHHALRKGFNFSSKCFHVF